MLIAVGVTFMDITLLELHYGVAKRTAGKAPQVVEGAVVAVGVEPLRGDGGSKGGVTCHRGWRQPRRRYLRWDDSASRPGPGHAVIHNRLVYTLRRARHLPAPAPRILRSGPPRNNRRVESHGGPVALATPFEKSELDFRSRRVQPGNGSDTI